MGGDIFGPARMSSNLSCCSHSGPPDPEDLVRFAFEAENGVRREPAQACPSGLVCPDLSTLV